MQCTTDELYWPAESARRHLYRHIQNLWRKELDRPPGFRTNKKTGAVEQLPNLLPASDQPFPWETSNFLSADAAAYARARAGEVATLGGSLDPVRLERNLLSSMPLAFNVFGHLRQRPALLALVLRDVTGLPITGVHQDPLSCGGANVDGGVECEWAPAKAQRAEFLGDRTAFDAMVVVDLEDGMTRFLGIEVKYTEPFSPLPKGFDAETVWCRYESVVKDDPVSSAEAVKGLFKSGQTWQLTRQLLLTSRLRREPLWDTGHAVVLCTEEDKRAAAAVDVVRRALGPNDLFLPRITLEALAKSVADHGDADDREWVARLLRRYVDPGFTRARRDCNAISSPPG